MSAIAKEQRSLRAQMDELNRNHEKLVEERAALDAELATLAAERGKIGFALDILGRLDDEAPNRPPRRGVSTGRRIDGGSADYAIRALADLGAASTAEEVVERMKALGWNAAVARPVEVARNALIRAIETGEVAKASRGKYEMSTTEDSTEDAVSGFGIDHGEPLARPSVDF